MTSFHDQCIQQFSRLRSQLYGEWVETTGIPHLVYASKRKLQAASASHIGRFDFFLDSLSVVCRNAPIVNEVYSVATKHLDNGDAPC